MVLKKGKEDETTALRIQGFGFPFSFLRQYLYRAVLLDCETKNKVVEFDLDCDYDYNLLVSSSNF